MSRFGRPIHRCAVPRAASGRIAARLCLVANPEMRLADVVAIRRAPALVKLADAVIAYFVAFVLKLAAVGSFLTLEPS